LLKHSNSRCHVPKGYKTPSDNFPNNFAKIAQKNYPFGQFLTHYQTIVSLSSAVIFVTNCSIFRYDCEEIWRQFEKAVVQQASCNVTEEHYFEMFSMMPQVWPCDRFLFWSKTRMLVHSYAAVFRHFWTLEDTLVGFLFNDLIWCGQEEDSGFDFNSCPAWSTCRTHPVYSLWKRASQNFAEMACGNITVLLNGSITNAFNRKSVELDSLNPQRVNYVNIKVVTNPEGPHM
uniref:ADP-ribosyl cyclase/cyclic ADP-ribose hydrolase n=1 Tax=Poecilia latipinna TaxID=48699 RepID=A0A3B3TKI8_9TELE